MATPAITLTANLAINTAAAERQVRDLERRLMRAGGAQPLGRLTANVTEFEKSLEAANARVIAFGASATIIAGVTSALKEMVTQTIQVEKSLADINSILGLSSRSLGEVGESLFTIAKQTGQSFDAVAEAAKEFSRQGLNVVEVQNRTRDAMILVRLSGLDAAKAVETLTATVNSFSKEGLSTADILNRLVSIDAKFAVSTKDLAEGLSRAGSSAQDAGVNLNELAALITTVQQRTARGGAVIGNAFKSIFTRLQRSDTLDQLEELGISVRDLSGEVLPATQILSSLAKAYDTLGDSQKSFVSELVGGVYQINILKSLFGDLGKTVPEYAKALEIANGATDEAVKRNEELNKTLATLANSAAQNFTKLSATFGKLIFGPSLERVLGSFNDFSDKIDGKGLGEKLGAGILKGIGNALSGPGLILASFLGGKLLTQFSRFAAESLVGISGVGKASERVQNVQAGINKLMSELPGLQAIIQSRTLTQIQKEEQILNIIRLQAQAREKDAKAIAAIAQSLVAVGIAFNPRSASFGVKTKAAGHIPTDKIPPEAILKEVVGAKQAGYKISPKDVRAMRTKIDGKATTVVYNSKEKVIQNYAGTGEPAIIPPNQSLSSMLFGAAGRIGGFRVGPEEFPFDRFPTFRRSLTNAGTFGRDYLGLKEKQFGNINLAGFSDDKSLAQYTKGVGNIDVYNATIASSLRSEGRNSPQNLDYSVASAATHEIGHNFFDLAPEKFKEKFAKFGKNPFIPLNKKDALNFLYSTYNNTSQRDIRRIYKGNEIEEALVYQFPNFIRQGFGADGYVPAAFGFGGKSVTGGIRNTVFGKRARAKIADSGSTLDYDVSRKDKEYSIKFIESLRKGDAHTLFSLLSERAKKKGYDIYSGSLVAQDSDVTGLDSVQAFYKKYPQLRYRKGQGKTSGFASATKVGGPSVDLEDLGAPQVKAFESIEDLEDFVKTLPGSPQQYDFSVDDLRTKFRPGGSIPFGALLGLFGNATTPEDSGQAKILSKKTRGAAIRNVVAMRHPEINDDLLGGDLKRLLAKSSPDTLESLVNSGLIRGVTPDHVKMLGDFGVHAAAGLNLTGLTKKELRKIAQQLGISGASGMNATNLRTAVDAFAQTSPSARNQVASAIAINRNPSTGTSSGSVLPPVVPQSPLSRGIGRLISYSPETSARVGQAGIIGSLALPAVGGFLGEQIGGRGGRAVSEATNAIGSGVALATVAGPLGAAVGGVIASFGLLKSVVNNLTPSLQDLAEEAKQREDVRGQRENSLAAFSQSAATLEDAIKGGARPEDIKRLRTSNNNAFQNLGEKERQALGGDLSFKNIQKTQDTLAKELIRSRSQDSSTLTASSIGAKKTFLGLRRENLLSSFTENLSFSDNDALTSDEVKELSNSLASQIDASEANETEITELLKRAIASPNKFDLRNIGQTAGFSRESLDKLLDIAGPEQTKAVVGDALLNLVDRIKQVAKQNQKSTEEEKSVESISKFFADNLRDFVRDIPKRMQEEGLRTLSREFAGRRREMADAFASQMAEVVADGSSAFLSDSGRISSQTSRTNAAADRNLNSQLAGINDQRQAGSEKAITAARTFASNFNLPLSQLDSNTQLRVKNRLTNVQKIERPTTALLELESILNDIDGGGSFTKGTEQKKALDDLRRQIIEERGALVSLQASLEAQEKELKNNTEQTKKNNESLSIQQKTQAVFLKFASQFSGLGKLEGNFSTDATGAGARERFARTLSQNSSTFIKNQAGSIGFKGSGLTEIDKESRRQALRLQNEKSNATIGRGLIESFQNGSILGNDQIDELVSSGGLSNSLAKRLRGQTSLATKGIEQVLLEQSNSALRQGVGAEFNPFLDRLSTGGLQEGKRTINKNEISKLQLAIGNNDFGSLQTLLQGLSGRLNKGGEAELQTLLAKIPAFQAQKEFAPIRAGIETKKLIGGTEPLNVGDYNIGIGKVVTALEKLDPTKKVGESGASLPVTNQTVNAPVNITIQTSAGATETFAIFQQNMETVIAQITAKLKQLNEFAASQGAKFPPVAGPVAPKASA